MLAQNQINMVNVQRENHQQMMMELIGMQRAIVSSSGTAQPPQTGSAEPRDGYFVIGSEKEDLEMPEVELEEAK